MSTRKNYTIVILGDSLQLHLAAYHLSEELLAAGVTIIPVELLSETNPSFRHVFTPFTPSLMPALKTLKANAKIGSLSNSNKYFPDGFSFSFSNYGTTSASISFLQAYEVACKENPSTPNFDHFLNTNAKSFGAIYSTQALADFYQRSCARKSIYTIPTESIKVNTSNAYIQSITTHNGQTLSADLFIDCSKDQHLINQLQTATEVSPEVIPDYKLTSKVTTDYPTETSCNINASEGSITRTVSIEKTKFEQRYDFTPKEQDSPQNSFYYQKAWVSNCIALGNGYCDIPDLLICRDRILETQLQTITKLLPESEDTSFAKKHYSTISNRLFNEAVDSINLLLQGLDNTIQLTPRNEQRKRLYASSATTHKEDHSMIDENSWGALLRLAGITPKNVNAIASTRNAVDIAKKINSLKSGEVG